MIFRRIDAKPGLLTLLFLSHEKIADINCFIISYNSSGFNNWSLLNITFLK